MYVIRNHLMIPLFYNMAIECLVSNKALHNCRMSYLFSFNEETLCELLRYFPSIEYTLSYIKQLRSH